jgi:hypothetical protein
MRGMNPYVLWSWAFSVAIEFVLLVLLFLKGNFRKLPFFTAYIGLNLCQGGFLVIVYSVYGFGSDRALSLGWYSECVTFFAQALATLEILRLTLKPFRGIWSIAWRALGVVAAVVGTLVVFGTRGSWALAGWFQINRGYHLTFATALIACLLVVRYYSIPVPAAYKMIMGGFCFYSCTDVIINTGIQTVLYKQFLAYGPVWEYLILFSFVLMIGIDIVALYKPLPCDKRQIPPPSDSSYQQLSPEINDRLRELNEKLLRLWKLETRAK